MDMWPKDIGCTTLKPKSPAVILREQAALLGNKTNNIVTAEVKRTEPKGGGSFFYSFYLVATPFAYRYKLFRIAYRLDNYYPIHFNVEDEELEKVLSEYLSEPTPAQAASGESTHPIAKSEDEFLKILGKIFSAEKTKRIINALIAESEG